MVTISLCMIVKNEEKTLPRCLDSIKDIVDEIVIIDTGSTDRTKEIAFQYTNNVFDFQWIDDFSAARNFSFSKATKEFIFWLDADDIMLNPHREALKSLKAILNPEFDVVVMKYILRTDDAGNETYSCYRERLVKRYNNYKWHDPIHEYLEFSGKVLHTEIAVTHTKMEDSSGRNLKILSKVLSESQNIHPRLIFYYARESEGIGNIEAAIEYYNKFLDMDFEGFGPYIEACIQLAKIYMYKDERKKALKTLIRSFEYEPMRAEVLCLIGKYYIDIKDYISAIPWYELALSLQKPRLTWQFLMLEYWDFIPCIELCHCYYHIGDLQSSLEYQRKAQTLKPYHSAVIENQIFFDALLKQIE